MAFALFHAACRAGPAGSDAKDTDVMEGNDTDVASDSDVSEDDTAVGSGGALVCQFDHEEQISVDAIAAADIQSLQNVAASRTVLMAWPDASSDDASVAIELDLDAVSHTWSTSVEEYDGYECEERWLVSYHIEMNLVRGALGLVWDGVWDGMAMPFTFTGSIDAASMPSDIWDSDPPILEQVWINGEVDSYQRPLIWIDLPALVDPIGRASLPRSPKRWSCPGISPSPRT